MTYIFKDTASQKIPLGNLINRTTGARILAGATARVCKDGTWAAAGGSLALEETDVWSYTPTQAETNCTLLNVTADHTDAVNKLVFGCRTLTVDPSGIYTVVNTTGNKLNQAFQDFFADNLSGFTVQSFGGQQSADALILSALGAAVDVAISTRATPAEVLAQVAAALASYDGPTKAEMDAALGGLSLGGAGGGVLIAEIGGELTPDKYLPVVQGEEKIVTFIVKADGRFENASADNIEVRFRDVRKNVVVVENDDIERVTEELDIQVIRATMSEEQTAALEPGLVRIQIAFDDQIATLTHSLKIVEGIE